MSYSLLARSFLGPGTHCPVWHYASGPLPRYGAEGGPVKGKGKQAAKWLAPLEGTIDRAIDIPKREYPIGNIYIYIYTQ